MGRYALGYHEFMFEREVPEAATAASEAEQKVA
jgi:hypothetical protein